MYLLTQMPSQSTSQLGVSSYGISFQEHCALCQPCLLDINLNQETFSFKQGLAEKVGPGVRLTLSQIQVASSATHVLCDLSACSKFFLTCTVELRQLFIWFDHQSPSSKIVFKSTGFKGQTTGVRSWLYKYRISMPQFLYLSNGHDSIYVVSWWWRLWVKSS